MPDKVLIQKYTNFSDKIVSIIRGYLTNDISGLNNIAYLTDASELTDASDLTDVTDVINERNYYIKNLILILSSIETRFFRLILNGGVALTNIYQLTARLHSDLDFTIKPLSSNDLTGATLTDELMNFYSQILHTLSLINEMYLSQNSIEITKEGDHCKIKLSYHSRVLSHTRSPSLSFDPSISLDFFYNKTFLSPNGISTFNKPTNSVFNFYCANPAEIFADKFVGLFRLISSNKISDKKDLNKIVRHLHDIFRIYPYISFDLSLLKLFQYIITNEKNHYPDYQLDSFQKIQSCISMLENNKLFEKNYNQFLAKNVFLCPSHSYSNIIELLKSICQKLLRLFFITQNSKTEPSSQPQLFFSKSASNTCIDAYKISRMYRLESASINFVLTFNPPLPSQ